MMDEVQTVYTPSASWTDHETFVVKRRSWFYAPRLRSGWKRPTSANNTYRQHITIIAAGHCSNLKGMMVGPEGLPSNTLSEVFDELSDWNAQLENAGLSAPDLELDP
jgi:ribosomal protein L32E